MRIQWNNSAEITTLETGHRVYPGCVAEAASADEIRDMQPGARLYRVGDGRIADPGDSVMAWNDDVGAYVAAKVLEG